MNKAVVLILSLLVLFRQVRDVAKGERSEAFHDIRAQVGQSFLTFISFNIFYCKNNAGKKHW